MSFLSSAVPTTFRISDRGFGLVELMVSISIMMLLTVVILNRQSSFNGAVLLRNQAYEVAFALRKAQLLAVSGNTGTASATTTQQYHLS
jgi:Tfp pilus assembly protein FimT